LLHLSADGENRLKKRDNALPWDEANWQWFEANQARLPMRVPVCNLLHMIRQLYAWG
jgi:hypothetical protein